MQSLKQCVRVVFNHNMSEKKMKVSNLVRNKLEKCQIVIIHVSFMYKLESWRIDVSFKFSCYILSPTNQRNIDNCSSLLHFFPFFSIYFIHLIWLFFSLFRASSHLLYLQIQNKYISFI